MIRYYLSVDTGNLNTQIAFLDAQDDNSIPTSMMREGLISVAEITDVQTDGGYYQAVNTEYESGEYSVCMIKRELQQNQLDVARPEGAFDHRRRATTKDNLTSAILRAAFDKAFSERAGTFQPSSEVGLVFTYPANWVERHDRVNNTQNIQYIENALRNILLPDGLKAVSINCLPEPCAAAMYRLDDMISSGVQLNYGDSIIVYDFGHGTTDLALIEITTLDNSGKNGSRKGQPIDPDNVAFDCIHESPNGGAHGGNEYVEQIENIIRGNIAKDNMNITNSSDNDIRRKARQAMIELNNNETAMVTLMTATGPWQTMVSKEDFVKATTGMGSAVEKSVRLLENEIDVALERGYMPKFIILTGGGSRIPHFVSAVEREMNNNWREDLPDTQILIEKDPLLAIAKGALLYAKAKDRLVQRVGFTFSAQKPVIGGSSFVELQTIIEEGSVLPVESEVTLPIVYAPGQEGRLEVRVHIYKGNPSQLNIINGFYKTKNFEVTDLGIKQATFTVRIAEDLKITVTPKTPGVVAVGNTGL